MIKQKRDKIETKNKIINISRSAFSVSGYESTSIRQIAREASVDPALIYHYFESKEELFFEVMRSYIKKNKKKSLQDLSGITGEYIIEKFLRLWGEENESTPLIGLMKSTNSFPKAASLLKYFVEQIITPYVANRVGKSDISEMISMIAVQLFGLMYTRYILKLEPISSMSIPKISSFLGSNISNLLNQNSETMENES